MRPRKIRQCRNHLHPVLTSLRQEIEQEPGYSVENNVLGIKVWLLPPWYYHLVLNDCGVRKCLADLIAPVPILPLRLLLVGELKGTEAERTGIQWTVGKGLLSYATFSMGDTPWTAFVHDEDWPQEIENLSRRRFKELGPDMLRGLSRSEIATLRSIYGTAVATPLAPETDKGPPVPAFGCVTAHTPRGVVLNTEEIDLCGVYMALAVPAIVEVILEHADLFS